MMMNKETEDVLKQLEKVIQDTYRLEAKYKKLKASDVLSTSKQAGQTNHNGSTF